MKKFLSTAGFIDPVSLITLGILVVGLIVTTAIVKNPDISLDIRNYAKKSVSAPRTSVTKSVKDEIEKILSNPAPIQPPPVVKEKKQKDDDANTTPVVLPAPAQPAPTSISNTAMEEFRCGEHGGDWKNGQCQSPGSTPIPTPKTVAPPPAVATPKPATNPFANITSGAGGGTIPNETTPTPTPKAVVPPPVVNP
ncbi:MAG: hypothetical protein U1C50_01030, partial [Patescibacteria group bacterium]|nr:hypothetical protein [Patescibacteria group bacterium]